MEMSAEIAGHMLLLQASPTRMPFMDWWQVWAGAVHAWNSDVTVQECRSSPQRVVR